MHVIRLTGQPVEAWEVVWTHPVRGVQRVIVDCVVGVDQVPVLAAFVPAGRSFTVQQLTR